MCAFRSELGSKGEKAGVVDGSVAHLTLMQETGVCILSKMCNLKFAES